MGKNPAAIKGAMRPMETVSWEEAHEFCQKLGLQTQREVRLATEAEWEYACRAGTGTSFHTGKTISTAQANYRESGPKGVYRGKTLPVGSFAANGFGLHDMHGNVMEWCEDWYAEYEKVDPHAQQGSTLGTARVLRGGCWFLHEGDKKCRSAARSWENPVCQLTNIGFRVVVVTVP
jgi:formylglycine-generating enzyme required for sulfatase activity